MPHPEASKGPFEAVQAADHPAVPVLIKGPLGLYTLEGNVKWLGVGECIEVEA